jgi:predicted AAA+ superfamily ATPase
MQMLWMKGLQKEVMGNVFETSVFSDLVKKYGTSGVFFWRTNDRKEIDFVLKEKSVPVPIEAKLNFANFKKSAVKYFLEKYGLNKYKVIGLRGDPTDTACIFPWQL